MKRGTHTLFSVVILRPDRSPLWLDVRALLGIIPLSWKATNDTIATTSYSGYYHRLYISVTFVLSQFGQAVAFTDPFCQVYEQTAGIEPATDLPAICPWSQRLALRNLMAKYWVRFYTGVKQCTFRWLISNDFALKDIVSNGLIIYHLIIITCISYEIIFTKSLPQLVNIAPL